MKNKEPFKDDGIEFDEHFIIRRQSIWKKISRYLWANFNHKLGHPELLSRFIREGKLEPLMVIPPPDTFWTRSVTYWHEWMNLGLSYHARKFHLDYRSPDSGSYRLCLESIYMPDVENLINEECIDGFRLDISDIGGISASKSGMHDIADIDDFPLIRCRDFVEPVSAEHLRDNMDHYEIRLDDMRFIDFTWTKRRIYWINAGGSHHLASARYQSTRLGIPVPLTGRITRFKINRDCIRRLREHWDMYLLPKNKVFGPFFKAMNAFMCPFGQSELPRHFHCPSEPEHELCVIWLRKDILKANAVAFTLKEAGFPDFGQELERLTSSPLSEL